MTRESTIRAIGNSAGTTIPKPLLERYHHLAEGDRIFLVETEDGILITPYDPDFAEAISGTLSDRLSTRISGAIMAPALP
jgi:antitoxin component of MazEF toxin-antitoxin module